MLRSLSLQALLLASIALHAPHAFAFRAGIGRNVGRPHQPTIHKQQIGKSALAINKLQSEDDEEMDESIKPRKELRFGPLGSLEVLAIVTSVFFAATVFLAGDVLLATPTQTTQTVFDADEVLQSDFRRIETSVPFQ